MVLLGKPLCPKHLLIPLREDPLTIAEGKRESPAVWLQNLGIVASKSGHCHTRFFGLFPWVSETTLLSTT